MKTTYYRKNLLVSSAAAVLIGVGFAPFATATFFDVAGEITSCDSFACGLAGIGVGDQISGFLEVEATASGPNSTFTETDILLAQLMVGTIDSGTTTGPFGSTSLTTDANGEIVSGTGQLTTNVDTPFGTAEVVLDLNATSSTWTATTGFFGLGEVANGFLSFTRRAEIDTDADGVSDDLDNCTLVANPGQLDTNGDGFGNICDPDIDNNGVVGFVDYAILTGAFLSVPGDANWNPDADFNGDNAISFAEIAIFPGYFLGAPGPSGLAR